MYVYIYIYVCIYIYMYVYMYIYIITNDSMSCSLWQHVLLWFMTTICLIMVHGGKYLIMFYAGIFIMIAHDVNMSNYDIMFLVMDHDGNISYYGFVKVN